MMYTYVAQTFEGETVSGTLDSDSKASVKNVLMQRKLIVKKIVEVKQRHAITLFKRKVNRKEMVFMFKNLSTMIRAGIPIMQSLDIMQEQVSQDTLKQALRKIRLDISRGLLLSESMAETNAFPILVPAIVRIGEESGSLDKSFLQLANFYLKQEKTTAKIMGAMAYPVLTMLVAVGVVYYLTTNVLPTILKTLPNKDNLGLSTKILMGLSDFLVEYQGLPVIGLIAIVFILVTLSQTVFKKQKDYMILKLPLYGSIIKKTKAVQFTTTLSILMEAGVNITDAIDIITQVMGNQAFIDNVREVKKGVIKGEQISANLSPGLFDKLVITIVSIGESTGDMKRPLQDIAEFLDEEVDRTVTNMVNMLTPISILIMAVIVGFIVMGVMGPMFSMYGSFS